MKNKVLLSGLSSLVMFLFIGCGSDSSSSSSDSRPSIGQAGSMSRFAISGDYLYTINQREMNILDISDAKSPKKVSKISVPFDVETLFAYKNSLYVGSRSGLYIYDNNEPTQPVRVSSFTHAQSCDPVVIFEDVAYITLSSGENCWNKEREVNRLEIVDVKDPYSPHLIKTVDMFEPKGLAVDEGKLFLCDGEAGLKVFDLNKTILKENVKVTLMHSETKEGVDCYDVIAKNKNLIVSNRENIRQFSYRSSPMEEQGQIK